MSDGKLVIGNRRYSSWSLRGWLLVRLAGPRRDGGRNPPRRRRHPGGAGCNRGGPGTLPGAWRRPHLGEPRDRRVLRRARAIPVAGRQGGKGTRPLHRGRDACGFSRFAPGDAVQRLPRVSPASGRNPDSLADIARVEEIWAETRAAWGGGGPYLFGAGFGAADAMFAPVVGRFLTYEPELSAESLAYCEAVRTHPLVDEWYRGAADEPGGLATGEV